MSTLPAILPEEVSTRPDARSDQRVKRTPHRTVHVPLVAMEACIVHQHDHHDGAADLYLAEAGASVIGGALFLTGQGRSRVAIVQSGHAPQTLLDLGRSAPPPQDVLGVTLHGGEEKIDVLKPEVVVPFIIDLAVVHVRIFPCHTARSFHPGGRYHAPDVMRIRFAALMTFPMGEPDDGLTYRGDEADASAETASPGSAFRLADRERGQLGVTDELLGEEVRDVGIVLIRSGKGPFRTARSYVTIRTGQPAGGHEK
jgi:hypothetical protein